MAFFVSIPNAHIETVNQDPAQILTLATNIETFTVPGVSLEQTCLAVRSVALEAGLYITSWQITAANTVKVAIYNSTVGTINPVAQDFNFIFV